MVVEVADDDSQSDSDGDSASRYSRIRKCWFIKWKLFSVRLTNTYIERLINKLKRCLHSMMKRKFHFVIQQLETSIISDLFVNTQHTIHTNKSLFLDRNACISHNYPINFASKADLCNIYAHSLSHHVIGTCLRLLFRIRHGKVDVNCALFCSLCLYAEMYHVLFQCNVSSKSNCNGNFQGRPSGSIDWFQSVSTLLHASSPKQSETRNKGFFSIPPLISLYSTRFSCFIP